MKLLPILAGTLMREAHAVCNSGDPIIRVTCHDDLMVQLQVVQDCLIERYPDVKVTELIISETGTDECRACTDANPQWTDSTQPDYCNPAGKFGAYNFLDSAITPIPVEVTSPNLWFKAGYCGSTMDIIDAITARFQTEIYKPLTVDPATQIVSQRTIIAATSDITCDYPREIIDFDMFPNANIVADGGNQGEKIQVDGVEDIKQGVFDLSVSDNGNPVNSGDAVPVGDSMQITATSNDAAITDFFLADCTASNGKAPADSDYRSLEMIRNGCMVDLGNLETAIGAASPNPGQYIAFKQFGFADQSAATITLDFVLTCSIKLGTAPTTADCEQRYTDDPSGGLLASGVAGRKRRQTEQTEFTQTTEYTIKLTENMLSDTHGDIVVAHSGQGKLDSEGGTSGAVTNAVALIAGTAIMLI